VFYSRIEGRTLTLSVRLQLRKAMFAPALALNQRVAVYEPKENEWYCGKVVAFIEKAIYTVHYDGGAKWPLTSAKDYVHVFRDSKEEEDFNTETVCL